MKDLSKAYPSPGQWGTCARCGYHAPLMSAHARASGGLVWIGSESWICRDGRECSLRLGRSRRAKLACADFVPTVASEASPAAPTNEARRPEVNEDA